MKENKNLSTNDFKYYLKEQFEKHSKSTSKEKISSDKNNSNTPKNERN